jgi:hypothetical protein
MGCWHLSFGCGGYPPPAHLQVMLVLAAICMRSRSFTACVAAPLHVQHCNCIQPTQRCAILWLVK